MKIKTSITLSEDVLNDVDRLCGKSGNRSILVEEALRAFLAERARKIRDDKDLDLLNRRARKLTKEAKDVLQYQVKR